MDVDTGAIQPIKSSIKENPSWLTNMHWPTKLVYTQIDANAEYTIRINGQGDSFININGQKNPPLSTTKISENSRNTPSQESYIKTG